MITRRTFLRASGLAGGTLLLDPRASLAGAPLVGAPLASATRGAPKRILILGGTGFIGPHQVRYAMERGHTVTLFNRGQTNPGLFPNVEKLQGDRAVGDYKSLQGREWDVVIDNPTTLPRWVRQAAEALTGHARHYVFVSTISVYAANATPDADETAPLATTTEPESEDARRLYGPLKALAEREVEKAFPGHATIIRPGLIVGPGDLSDRFTYWPARLQRGGEVLAPGTPLDPVQIIDARDLAEFIVRCAEDGTTGIYNVTGPRSPFTIGEMLGGIRAALTSDVRLTWVDADTLAAQQVRPWSDMPVWIPPRGQTAGFLRRSTARALARGLTFRPFADTVRATLDFYEREPEERKAQLRAGIAPEREREVLALWHRQSRPAER